MSNKGKRVVVTGGAGFLGSHVADALSEAGHRVVIFDIQESSYLRADQESIIGDILDMDSLRDAFSGADAVYHLAALADLGDASKAPGETVQLNIQGTVNVLEAIVSLGIDRFIFASSMYVYSDKGSFYRISKLASEQIVEEFARQHGFSHTILRYGSLYGPRADERNGVRCFISQALERGEIVHRGSKNDHREFVHVRDAARVSAQVLDGEHTNQYYDIVGPHNLPVRDVHQAICDLAGGGDIRIVESDFNYSETPHTFKLRKGEPLLPDQPTAIKTALPDLVEEIRKELTEEA